MVGRILLVMPDHWERVLVRAELLERGYDAVGSTSPEAALLIAPFDPERGLVRVLVLDQEVAEGEHAALLPALRTRHLEARTLLIAHPTLTALPGQWDRVLSRPMTIGDLAASIEGLWPARVAR